MTISDGERVIIHMLESLGRKLGLEGQFALIADAAMQKDTEWQLKELMPSQSLSNISTPEYVSETKDILDMYRGFDASMRDMSAEEKSEIKRICDEEYLHVEFIGFDGNNEDHFAAASFLINDMGYWSEQSGKDLNSHMEMVPIYRKMLATLGQCSNKGYELSRGEIIEVARAGRVSM